LGLHQEFGGLLPQQLLEDHGAKTGDQKQPAGQEAGAKRTIHSHKVARGQLVIPELTGDDAQPPTQHKPMWSHQIENPTAQQPAGTRGNHHEGH